jgi:hypothetical protein
MPTGAFANLPAALKTVSTRPLFVLRLEVTGPIIVGDAAGSFRRIGVVNGGSFEGDRLAGNVMVGGSDWQVVRTDGVTTLDVRLSLETDDGAKICMTYQGLRHGPKEVIEKMEKGVGVDPADYYFRTNPVFATAAPNYAWLNRLISVGVGHREAGVPTYSVFEIL